MEGAPTVVWGVMVKKAQVCACRFGSQSILNVADTTYLQTYSNSKVEFKMEKPTNPPMSLSNLQAHVCMTASSSKTRQNEKNPTLVKTWASTSCLQTLKISLSLYLLYCTWHITSREWKGSLLSTSNSQFARGTSFYFQVWVNCMSTTWFYITSTWIPLHSSWCSVM